MFKRYLISDLEKWANEPNRKPLILRGARQVGKTTLVQYFAKNFDRFISLNLEKQEHKRIFESDYSFEQLLNAIFFLFNQRKDNKKTLIFIDEIQNSSQAVASLRYFYEESPEIHVIAAGSLLETLINRTISFPVGRVEYLAVRPCSFREFLVATNESAAVDALSLYPPPPFIHDKLSDLFHIYTLIGGMPEIISNYAQNKDLVKLNRIYQSILTSYKDDVEKYATSLAMVHYIRHILKTGFGYCGQRIRFEHFGESEYKSREMGEAFRMLEKTFLLELVYPTTSNTLPLISDFKKSPRLHWFDTGLVNFAARIQTEVFMNNDITSTWKGLIAEHIAGQELLAMETDVLATRTFWVRESKNSNAEIDYVIPFNSLLIPVEIKNLSGTSLKSLHLFMEKAPHQTAVRIWAKPFSIDHITLASGKKFKLINIPFYLISAIYDIIAKEI